MTNLIIFLLKIRQIVALNRIKKLILSFKKERIQQIYNGLL